MCYFKNWHAIDVWRWGLARYWSCGSGRRWPRPRSSSSAPIYRLKGNVLTLLKQAIFFWSYLIGHEKCGQKDGEETPPHTRINCQWEECLRACTLMLSQLGMGFRNINFANYPAGFSSIWSQHKCTFQMLKLSNAYLIAVVGCGWPRAPPAPRARTTIISSKCFVTDEWQFSEIL